MQPSIVEKEGFTVVGLKARCKGGETGDIPQLWNRLMERMGEIEGLQEESAAYGVMTDYDEDTGQYDYIAAFAVHEARDVPEGMVSVEIPPQTYAVFTATMPTLEETYETIFERWLPQAEYEHAPGPEFELYPPTFDPQDADSQLEIYIPIV
ncbi:MAG: GyrI-like domain-containing protein [Anaerolineae bacterium]